MQSGTRIGTSFQPQPRVSPRIKHARSTICLILLLMASVASFSFVALAGKSGPKGVADFEAWASYIAEASQRFGVPAHWIRAVMRLESDGDDRTLSRKGTMGLMQVMPETYAELRLRYHLGDDPYEPRNNILAGTAYLRKMLDRYGPAGFLAAYNAGPNRYEDYLARGRLLPAETQDYVAALAPIIGVSTLPRGAESAPIASQSPTLIAAHDKGAQALAPNDNMFLPQKSPFRSRPDMQARMLFQPFVLRLNRHRPRRAPSI